MYKTVHGLVIYIYVHNLCIHARIRVVNFGENASYANPAIFDVYLNFSSSDYWTGAIEIWPEKSPDFEYEISGYCGSPCTSSSFSVG